MSATAKARVLAQLAEAARLVDLLPENLCGALEHSQTPLFLLRQIGTLSQVNRVSGSLAEMTRAAGPLVDAARDIGDAVRRFTERGNPAPPGFRRRTH